MNQTDYLQKEISFFESNKEIKGIVHNFFSNPITGIPVLKVKVENYHDAQGRKKGFVFLSPKDVALTKRI